MDRAGEWIMAGIWWRHGLSAVRRKVDWLDALFITQLRARASLMAVMLGIGLILWGTWQGNIILDAEVVLAGATGYTLGLVPAVAVGIAAAGAQWVLLGPGFEHPAVNLLEFLGCAYIAWLGREHRQLADEQKLALAGIQHERRVIPWSLVNEVRNSLMAMRLLLTDRRSTANADQVKLVEQELLRLESIFGNLPREGDSTKHA